MIPLAQLADGELFGNDAGEDEIPDVLASYFVDQAAFAPFLSKSTRLQVARSRKGMGKSALLSKFAFDLKKTESNVLVIQGTGSDLVGIASPNNFDYLPLQNYWKQTICARINFELGKSIGFAFSDASMALVETAELSGFKGRNIVGSLLQRLRSSKVPIELTHTSVGDHSELLRRALDEYRNFHVWILIDDIDSTYINTPEQQAVTSTFFSACRSLVRDIGNLSIRASVRTDVWGSFRQNEDLDKFEQYITDISWTKEELKNVLSKKIHSYYKRHFPTSIPVKWDYENNSDLLLELAFDRRMRWGNSRVPPFQPVQILSAGRPRWMAQLCRLAGQDAARHEKIRIGIQEINAVMKRFGRMRLNDLYKEHSHQFSDLQRLIETFSSGRKRYSTVDLNKRLILKYTNVAGSANIPPIDGFAYKAPLQLAHFLFKVGFLVGRREQHNNPDHADFVRYEERVELLTDTRNPDDGLLWEIYPSYRNVLNVR